jgi:RNA polymerase sigma-70 factor, ECF subfamily
MRKHNARCRDIWVLGRVYVTDSRIRSHVGRVVSRAAVQQGIQFRRLHSVWPVASAWVTGILAMNTARSSNDIVPSHQTFAGTVAFSDPATDQALVATAKMGDEEAFETLVKRHRTRIFALALRYTRVREDAEDVVQQTFQKTFVYFQNFEGKSSFSTWLTRIAINEALMFLRRARALREMSIDGETGPHFDIADERPDPEATYLKREEARIQSVAISGLTPRLRSVLELTELRELSARETARQMGLSVAAVKARVFHGRKKLRKHIAVVEASRKSKRVFQRS